MALTEDSPNANHRRWQTLRAVTEQVREAQTIAQVYQSLSQAIATNPIDLPFVLLYQLVDSPPQALLQVNIGFTPLPRQLNWQDADPWQFSEILDNLQPLHLPNLPPCFSAYAPLAPAQQALVIPLQGIRKTTPLGVIVMGLAAPDPLDTDYRLFLDTLSFHIAAILDCTLAQEKLIALEAQTPHPPKSELRFQQLAEIIHSEKRYRRLLNSNLFGVAFADFNGTIHYANDYFLQMVGYTPEDLKTGQMNWEMLTPPEYLELDQKAIAELKQFGQATPFEKEYFRKDGSRVSILIGTALLEESDKQQPEIIGFFLNLTEIKQAEAALKESETRFRQLAENIQDVFWLSDPQQQQILYVSPAYETIWGRSCESLYRNFSSWIEAVHPEDQETVRTATARSRAGESLSLEYRILRPDGSWRWIRDRGFVIRDAQNRPYRLAGIAEDITDYKNVQQELQNREACFRRLVESNMFGVAIGDFDGRFLYVNDALLDIVGYSRAEMLSETMRWMDLTPPEYLTLDWQAGEELRERGRITPFQKEYIHKDGHRVPILIGAALLDLPNLPQNQVICFYLDLTPLKQKEAQLRQYALQQKQVEIILRDALQKLNFHVENSPLAVIEWDRNLRILRWSAAAERLFGWQAEAVLGKQMTDWQFIYEADQEAVQEACQQILAGTHPQIVSYNRNYTQDHRVVYCEWYNSTLLDERGQMTSVLSLVLDVTERQHALTALQESEERYRSLVKASSQIVWQANAEGQIVVVEGWEDFTGQPATELILGGSRTAIHPDDLERINEAWWNAVKNHTIFEEEHRIRKYDGSYEYFQVRGIPVFDEAWQVRAWVGMSTNIHARKMAQESLRLNRERLDLVLDAAQLGLWYCDLPFSQLTWNERCKAHFGLAADAEVTIATFYESLHPDDRERTAQAITTAIRDRLPYDIDYRTLGPDGGIRWIRAIGRAFYDQWGTPKRFDGVTIDITERKREMEERDRLLQQEQAARQLAELQIHRISQLQQLTAALAEALTRAEVAQALLDRGLAAFQAQRGWVVQRLGDSTTVEMIKAVGYRVEELEPYQNLPLTGMTPLTDAVRTGEMVIVRSPQEYRQRYPDLAEPFIQSGTQALVAIPLAIEGSPIGALGLSFQTPREFDQNDRNFLSTLAHQCAQALERARLYEAERIAREQAEAANRIKDEFLAVLSHELRSPLNPILGWTQLLKVRQFDEGMLRRALEIIERNAKLQTQLIEDLLDVSRILRGKLVLEVAPVPLKNTLEAALETVRLAAEAKNIQIQTRFCPEKALVSGDANRLQQVIWNLLSNAVKFTPSGGQVVIELAVTPQWVVLEVQDTGIGIKPEFLQYVFEYFRQEDGTTTRKFGGLGLGLAIVRHLVELHGGTVRANSPGENQGATFTVQLPRLVTTLAIAPSKSKSPQTLNWQGIRLLIVDDEADMRELALTILSAYGAQVRAVSKATEALSAILTFQPHLLISDIGMPEIDGYQLMRNIRQLPADQGGKIPAIALTAYAGEMNHQQALQAGFQLHLAKPVEPEHLIQAIADFLHLQSP